MDARLSAALGSGGGIESFIQGLNLRGRTEGHTHCHRFQSNNRGEGRKERSNEKFDFETSRGSGAGAPLRKQNYLGDEGHQQHQATEEKSEKRAGASMASDVYAREAVENSAAETEARVAGSKNEFAEAVADGGWIICGKGGTESEASADDEGVQREWENGGSIKCTRGKRQQQQRLPDDCVDTNNCRSGTDNSDYAKGSFEPTNGVMVKSEDGPLAEGRDTFAGHGGAIVALDGRSYSEESLAAAKRIEACWRGFRARSIARCALRSVLLNALRKIGGGKISKVNKC